MNKYILILIDYEPNEELLENGVENNKYEEAIELDDIFFYKHIYINNIQVYSVLHKLETKSDIKEWVLLDESSIKQDFIKSLPAEITDEESKFIIAGHWGDGDESLYKELIKRVNKYQQEEKSDYYISYFGSSLTGGTQDYKNVNDNIITKIIKWAGITAKGQVTEIKNAIVKAAEGTEQVLKKIKDGTISEKQIDIPKSWEDLKEKVDNILDTDDCKKCKEAIYKILGEKVKFFYEEELKFLESIKDNDTNLECDIKFFIEKTNEIKKLYKKIVNKIDDSSKSDTSEQNDN